MSHMNTKVNLASGGSMLNATPQAQTRGARPRSKNQRQKTGERILSGDPRLRGLEQIYLKKFVGPSSNSKGHKRVNSSKPKTRPPKTLKVNNFKADHFTLDQHSPTAEEHKQAQFVSQIEALEQDYLANSFIQGVQAKGSH